MGETSIYVFERDDDRSPGFVERATRELAKRGVIELSRPPAHLDQLFGRQTDVMHFDHLGVRMTKLPGLIPEDPAVEPRCRACKADLREAWYETTNDEYEREPEQDWTRVALTCAACGKRGTVLDVDDQVGVFARREFVYFAHVTATRGDDEIVDRIREALGDVAVVFYWYT